MAKSEFLDELFDKKKLTVIRHFIDNPEENFYLREISKRTKTSVSSTFRIVRLLKRLEIIDEVRLKKFKAYKLSDNEKTALLDKFVATKRSAIQDFINGIKKIVGVEQVLLHGKEASDKASLLIIGKNLPSDKIQKLSLDVRDRFNYNIIYLTLDKEQFNQMTSMGLYPGKKAVLYRK